MVGAPSGNVVVKTWRSALLVEMVPVVITRLDELEDLELVVSSASDDEAGLSEVDSTELVSTGLDSGSEEVGEALVGACVVVVLPEVDVCRGGFWLEVRAEDGGSSSLLVETVDEGGTADEDVRDGGLDVDGSSGTEGVDCGPAVLLLPLSCRLPSKPETADSASDEASGSSRLSDDGLISSGQYSA